jgi:hypothetical protein
MSLESREVGTLVYLGQPWAALGFSWGCFGASWCGDLGAILGPLVALYVNFFP